MQPLVIVVGDIMLDVATRGHVGKITREAPVPVVNLQEPIQYGLGGAGNVAAALRGLGLPVGIVSAVGDDKDGEKVKQLLHGIGVSGVMLQTHKTTVKNRITASDKMLLRLDTEQYHELPGDSVLDPIRTLIAANNVLAVVVSDYGKGAMTVETAKDLVTMCNAAGVPTLVDCREHMAHAYAGCTLIKPNQLEAKKMVQLLDGVHPALLRDDPYEIGELGCRTISKRLGIPNVVITLGGRGCAYTDVAGVAYYDSLPRSNHPVVDICGAGDTVLAALTYAMLQRKTLSEAALFSMYAAGIAVRHPGVYTVTLPEVEEVMYLDRGYTGKIMTADELQRFVSRRKGMKQRIVFTNGCFDGLHAGHIELFRYAKTQGDTVVVLLNDDQSLRALKGEHRPAVPCSYRVTHVAMQTPVDAVSLFDGDVMSVLKLLKPEVLVKGADNAPGQVPGADYVAGYGGIVSFCPVLMAGSVKMASTTTHSSWGSTDGETDQSG